MLRPVSSFLENRQKIANCKAGLSGDVPANYFASCHCDLTRDIKPSARFNGSRKGKVLPARAFAALHAISLDAHSVLLPLLNY
jgi:hypothetical protein